MIDIEISDLYFKFDDKIREHKIKVKNRGQDIVVLALRANRGSNNAQIFSADFVEKVLVPNKLEEISVKFIGNHSEPNDPIYMILRGRGKEKRVLKINWEFSGHESDPEFGNYSSDMNDFPFEWSIFDMDFNNKESDVKSKQESVKSKSCSESSFEDRIKTTLPKLELNSEFFNEVYDSGLRSTSSPVYSDSVGEQNSNKLKSGANSYRNEELVHLFPLEKSNYQLLSELIEEKIESNLDQLSINKEKDFRRRSCPGFVPINRNMDSSSKFSDVSLDDSYDSHSVYYECNDKMTDEKPLIRFDEPLTEVNRHQSIQEQNQKILMHQWILPLSLMIFIISVILLLFALYCVLALKKCERIIKSQQSRSFWHYF